MNEILLEAESVTIIDHISDRLDVLYRLNRQYLENGIVDEVLAGKLEELENIRSYIALNFF